MTAQKRYRVVDHAGYTYALPHEGTASLDEAVAFLNQANTTEDCVRSFRERRPFYIEERDVTPWRRRENDRQARTERLSR